MAEGLIPVIQARAAETDALRQLPAQTAGDTKSFRHSSRIAACAVRRLSGSVRWHGRRSQESLCG